MEVASCTISCGTPEHESASNIGMSRREGSEPSPILASCLNNWYASSLGRGSTLIASKPSNILPSKVDLVLNTNLHPLPSAGSGIPTRSREKPASGTPSKKSANLSRLANVCDNFVALLLTSSTLERSQLTTASTYSILKTLNGEHTRGNDPENIIKHAYRAIVQVLHQMGCQLSLIFRFCCPGLLPLVVLPLLCYCLPFFYCCQSLLCRTP
ncbi:uncharacterized protein LOC130589601 isoform X2 [Beta vulgaris subsp. vulgaris]|uniref:uncharacterized protein LOC130589601 isoform X2 n=1 Tax=Beta vulgaris subsp. vulgaris TaxID=3555 RepID=UPI0025488D49|nr:uncharacterized protein LOC130589601 isoform X2 [Beta vulgaris subsp. vulgaris]